MAHDVPRTREVPLLGAAPWLTRDPLTFFVEEHQRLGPVYQVRVPGRRLTVLAGRDANGFVNTKGRDAFDAAPFWHRMTVPEYDARNMILTVDGEEHRTIRHAMRSALSRVAVEAQDEGLTDLMPLALKSIEDTLDDPRGASLTYVTRLVVSRVIHHLMTDGHAEPVDEELALAMMERFRWETNARLLGKWPTAVLKLRSHRERVARVDEFVDGLIEKAERNPQSEWEQLGMRLGDLFPRDISRGDLRLHFAFPYVVGVDTVGVTLAFLLYEASRRPEMVARLRDEIRGACGDDLTEKNLRGLPFLDAVIKESLRRYPAAFGMYRRAARDFEFEGVRVRAGHDVLVLTSAGHFDPRYYTDPMRFDPERHLAPRSEPGEKNVFMPYGAGPHVCLGAGMGEGILRRLVAEIVCRFDFAYLSGPSKGARVHTYDPSLTLRSDVRVSVTKAPSHLPAARSSYASA